MATRYQNGVLVDEWRLTPLCVYGGFQVHWSRWVRTEDGWEPEDRPSGDEMVYPTMSEALAAVERLRG